MANTAPLPKCQKPSAESDVLNAIDARQKLATRSLKRRRVKLQASNLRRRLRGRCS
jgi:hypothetical protein